MHDILTAKKQIAIHHFQSDNLQMKGKGCLLYKLSLNSKFKEQS